MDAREKLEAEEALIQDLELVNRATPVRERVAQKLVEMGWRKVAPVDTDESESTGDVKSLTEKSLLQVNFPNKCTAADTPSGRYAVPWDPHRRICGMETEHESDRCWFHGGPSDTVTVIAT